MIVCNQRECSEWVTNDVLLQTTPCYTRIAPLTTWPTGIHRLIQADRAILARVSCSLTVLFLARADLSTV